MKINELLYGTITILLCTPLLFKSLNGMATGEKSRIFEHQSELALRITDRKAELDGVKHAISDLKNQVSQSFAEQKAEVAELNKKIKETKKLLSSGLNALNKKFVEIKSDINAKESLINKIVMSDADRNDFKDLLKPIKITLAKVDTTLKAMPNDRALRAPRTLD